MLMRPTSIMRYFHLATIALALWKLHVQDLLGSKLTTPSVYSLLPHPRVSSLFSILPFSVSPFLSRILSNLFQSLYRPPFLAFLLSMSLFLCSVRLRSFSFFFNPWRLIPLSNHPSATLTSACTLWGSLASRAYEKNHPLAVPPRPNCVTPYRFFSLVIRRRVKKCNTLDKKMKSRWPMTDGIRKVFLTRCWRPLESFWRAQMINIERLEWQNEGQVWVFVDINDKVHVTSRKFAQARPVNRMSQRIYQVWLKYYSFEHTTNSVITIDSY